MSEERFEQDKPKDETEDVEGHVARSGVRSESDEPRSEEESDDVEAHQLRAQNRAQHRA